MFLLINQGIYTTYSDNNNWVFREITGEEDVDGVPHYLVECPTLIPKDSMGHAAELVAEFEARQTRARASLRVKKERKGRPYFKRGKHASVVNGGRDRDAGRGSKSEAG